MKRLYRSRTNKVVSGVCGGIGNYFNTDPVLIRVLAVFASCISGLVPGLIAYIFCVSLIPLEPEPLTPSN